MKALALILAAGLVALGCQKSEPPAPLAASAAPAAAPTAAPAASVAADPAVPAADTTVAVNTAAPAAAAPAKAVPTEADYEVQAQSAITPANAAQVLTAIDKQVGN